MNPGDDLVVGRFAPSPTGSLHLGSLVAAVGSFLFARAARGRWLVRVEDLDTPRVVPGSSDEILASLELYALHRDGEIVRQSDRLHLYEDALERLRHAGAVFDCACSRAEIRRVASAPAPGDEIDRSGAVYPGTCRNGIPAGRPPRAIRFRVSDEIIRFTDLVVGQVEEGIAIETGDFVVKRADGVHAYQLAVVVDDIAQGVTQVVRGGDLLGSTARQIALARALGAEPPVYGHLPLLVNRDGEKLSKRDGALPISTLDETTITSSLLAALTALGLPDVTPDTPDRMLTEAVERLDSTRIPRGTIQIE